MPVATLIVVCPAVKVKAIKGDSLHADAKLDECGTHLAIEAILVHAEETGRVAQTDKARGHWHRLQ